MGLRTNIRQVLRKNSGGVDFIARRTNLIEGPGIQLTFVADSANNETAVTIVNTGSNATFATQYKWGID